jgi:hypothetical protein
VRDGLLTCHWHRARFDLAGGGTLDPFADNVRSFPVHVDDDDVFVVVDNAAPDNRGAGRLVRLEEAWSTNWSSCWPKPALRCTAAGFHRQTSCALLVVMVCATAVVAGAWGLRSYPR